MKICLVLISLGVCILHSASSQRTMYIPDRRYSKGRYPSSRRHRSMMLDSPYGSDPGYAMGSYSLGKTFPTGEGQDHPGYSSPRRAWESRYPSMQGFEDAYPAFSPHRHTKPGHPYHSQRIRIKHSFPSGRQVDSPSPYLQGYGDRMLPQYGGYRHLAGGGASLGSFGGMKPLGQYGGGYADGQFRGGIPQMNKLLPQYDAMDPRMLQYARQPNTIVVEKKIPVPYKVRVEKPYFVEVTKHVAVPVAVPVPKPMPYAVNKYIEVPKYIQVPSTLVKGDSYQQRSSTPAPQYLSSPASTPSSFMSSPQHDFSQYSPSPSPSPAYSSTPQYAFSPQTTLPPGYSLQSAVSPLSSIYRLGNEPEVSIHPNGLSLASSTDGIPSSTETLLSGDALDEILRKSYSQGAITLDELQGLMLSEKNLDDSKMDKK